MRKILNKRTGDQEGQVLDQWGRVGRELVPLGRPVCLLNKHFSAQYLLYLSHTHQLQANLTLQFFEAPKQ